MPHNTIRDRFYSLFPNKSKYLSMGIGETNIILSAPHGGDIKPWNIPDRKYGNKSRDTYTRRLIQEVINLLPEKPYYIYSDIHRSKIDFNREIDEATQGNSIAEGLWRDWNNLLNLTTQEIRDTYNSGLYVDIHSHNNSNKFQIGYGLSVRDYLYVRSDFPTKKHSTMYPLIKGNPEQTEHNLLFGKYSIVRYLEKTGYQVLVPKEEDKYLNGGRNIHVYNGYGIGAIQIECPIPVLQGNLGGVAETLANAIVRFQERFL